MSTMKEDKFHWLASGPLFYLSDPGQEGRNIHINPAARVIGLLTDVLGR